MESLRPTISSTTPAIFFFSSRRRHTRSTRDWSSDVCSSDLFPVVRDVAIGMGQLPGGESVGGEALVHQAERSEERRVGKECKYRRSEIEYKEKRSEICEYFTTHVVYLRPH